MALLHLFFFPFIIIFSIITAPWLFVHNQRLRKEAVMPEKQRIRVPLSLEYDGKFCVIMLCEQGGWVKKTMIMRFCIWMSIE